MFLTELQRGAAPRSQLVPPLRLAFLPQPPAASLERPPSGRLASTSANRSRPHLAASASAAAAGLPDGYASTRDASTPIPAGASVYALSSHSSAVASRSPTRVPPRSRPEVIVAAPPPPPAESSQPLASRRTPVAPNRLASSHQPRPPPQRATTSATASAAAPSRKQRIASPFDLGDDDERHGYHSSSSSSGDEYDLYSSRSSTVMRARGGDSPSEADAAAAGSVGAERESVLAYLPDTAHAHLPPTIDLALKRVPHRSGGGGGGSIVPPPSMNSVHGSILAERDSNRASARYASSASAFSIGALTARENARLGDLYYARAARTERLQQQEWSERAKLAAASGSGGGGEATSGAGGMSGEATSGAAVFDQMVAKIKQVLGGAKNDKGGIELVEGQVMSGQLEKGDTRLYKAFVAQGKTEVKLEMKREGHAHIFVSPTSQSPSAEDHVWRSTNPVDKLLIASAANGGAAFASGCWFHITVFAQTSVPDYRLRFTTSYSSTEHGGTDGRSDAARQSSEGSGAHSSGHLPSHSSYGDHHDDDGYDDEGGDSTRVMRATDLAERMRANLRLLKEDAFARDQLETRVRRRLDEQRAQRREKAERAAAKAAANARVRDEAVHRLLSRGHGGGKKEDVAESGGGAVPALAPEADLAIALQTARGDFTARNRMPTSFAPHAIEVRKRQWQAFHNAKISQAAHLRIAQEEERGQAQDAERERSENVDREIAERCLKERMRARVEGMQKRWLIWLAFLHRTDALVSRVRTAHAARLQREREEAAVQVLVRALRTFNERRRRRRLHAALVSARLVLRVCAHNYACVQSDRSVDVIVAFMGQMTGTRSLNVIIGNFRKKTLRAQALTRAYLSVRAAKLATWQRQWAAAERQILADEYAPADAALDESETEAIEMARVEQEQQHSQVSVPLVVPASARAALLSAKMDEMQKESIRNLTEYRHAMIDYERMRDFAELKRRYMGADVVIGGNDAAAAANAPAPRLARVPMLLPARHLEALVRRALSERDALRDGARKARQDLVDLERQTAGKAKAGPKK